MESPPPPPLPTDGTANYNNSQIQQSPPSLETWKPVNELKSDTFDFNTLTHYNKAMKFFNELNHASRFGVKFEIIHPENKEKKVLDSYQLTPMFVAKGSSFSLEILEDEIPDLIPNRRQINKTGYPMLHSESAGIAYITKSDNPGNNIDKESSIMQYINYYKNQYNEALRGGDRLRAKFYVDNANIPPCTPKNKYYQYGGTYCTPAIYGFLHNLSEKTDVDTRMYVKFGEDSFKSDMKKNKRKRTNAVRFGVKGGGIDTEYVNKNKDYFKANPKDYIFDSLEDVKKLKNPWT